jgi:glutaconyl-CoA/methylmalonyl-CoA decarboxylase subunit gamma
MSSMTEPFAITIDGDERSATVEPLAPGELCVTLEGHAQPLETAVLVAGRTAVVTVEGRVLTLLELGDGRWYDARARRVVLTERARSRKADRSAPAAAGAAELHAPMPGRIVRVLVAEGDAVAAGAGVVVIEAMKMENELAAPRAGTVLRVAVRTGDAVERDALLLEIG